MMPCQNKQLTPLYSTGPLVPQCPYLGVETATGSTSEGGYEDSAQHPAQSVQEFWAAFMAPPHMWDFVMCLHVGNKRPA